MYKIDDNVPLPVEFQNKAKYPIGDLKPKQSFFVPARKGGRVQVIARRLSVCVANAHRRYTDRRFTMRQKPDGVRVWRVK